MKSFSLFTYSNISQKNLKLCTNANALKLLSHLHSIKNETFFLEACRHEDVSSVRCYTMPLANSSQRFGDLYYPNLQGITVSDPKDGNSTFLWNAENYLAVETMYVTAKEPQIFIFLAVCELNKVAYMQYLILTCWTMFLFISYCWDMFRLQFLAVSRKLIVFAMWAASVSTYW